MSNQHANNHIVQFTGTGYEFTVKPVYTEPLSDWSFCLFEAGFWFTQVQNTLKLAVMEFRRCLVKKGLPFIQNSVKTGLLFIEGLVSTGFIVPLQGP